VSGAKPNWFVALAVPTESWWARVGPPPAAVRLFHPADVHITVAFLGPVSVEAAEGAFELAPRWGTGSLDVTLGRIEPMGNPRRPNALSAIVSDGAEALVTAISAIRGEMIACAGAKADSRPPLPHATIARPLRSAIVPERDAAVAWARSLDLGSPRVRLSRLVLYGWGEDRSVRLFREHAEYGLIPNLEET